MAGHQHQWVQRWDTLHWGLMKGQQGHTRGCIQRCSAIYIANPSQGSNHRIAESSLALCSNLHSLAGWAATICHLQNIVSHLMTALNRTTGLATDGTQEHGWQPARLRHGDALCASLQKQKSLNYKLAALQAIRSTPAQPQTGSTREDACSEAVLLISCGLPIV